ncbi:hypothetical protein [Acetobacter sicerae]|uniref:hypothetical protein n=1 Tax=Acetobacter sicerae TaxID=85325 RepID=UPI00156B5639|nr:hypothetical protein [Acetobacter sicerae]NHN93528.1 hypothetical protein [Acetobacter sicerae]
MAGANAARSAGIGATRRPLRGRAWREPTVCGGRRTVAPPSLPAFLRPLLSCSADLSRTACPGKPDLSVCGKTKKGRHTDVHRPLKIVVGMPYSEAELGGYPEK